MLSPDYLEHFTDDITELYNHFADSVIEDMARRIGKIGVTDTSVTQIEIMQQAGQLRGDVLRRLATLTKMSETELNRLFINAGAESIAYDNQIYTQAGLNPLPLKQSPPMLATLLAGMHKTKGNLHNLTMTTAASAQVDFINAMNLAYQQTITGAMSYTEAVKRAVTGLAGNGVSVIHYPSGHRDKVDVAARRAVLTGVNSTIGQAQLIHARELKCNHMETTGHFGARPDHQIWQARVFTINGSSPQYPNLVDATGYGSGQGLMGWNCRHSMHPFFPGISAPAYSKGEYDDRIVSYNGVEMTQYNASQKQRAMERSIRQTRRELSALNAAAEATTDEALRAELKAEFTRLSAKLKGNEAKYTAFSNATGLRKQPERLQTFGFNRSVSSRAVWANRAFTKTNNAVYNNTVKEARKSIAANPKIIVAGQQNKHIVGTHEYNQSVQRLFSRGQYGPSKFNGLLEDAQHLLTLNAGTGRLGIKNGKWLNYETIVLDTDKFGTVVNNLDGTETPTRVFRIHYRKSGAHIVPDYPSKERSLK